MPNSTRSEVDSVSSSVLFRHMSLRRPSSVISTDDVVCTISARKYTSSRRYFYVLRRAQNGGSEDMDLYRASVLSSCSTRSSVLSDSGSSSRPFLLDALLRQMPWLPYRSQRSTDEETNADESTTGSSRSCPDLENEAFESSNDLEQPPEQRFEVACFKSREHWREGRAPKLLMDVHELLYISSFKQRVDRKTVQYCLSLCGERCGITFWTENESEWRRFRERLNDAFMKCAKRICHHIEYACNVVIKHKGLAKFNAGPSVQPVLPGSYRLLLMDSKVVFVRDSIAKPAFTIYYQWVRRMVRQMQYTMLRRAQSVFILELGHMSDTGEGFLYFRVLDEPSQRESQASGAGVSALPDSPLSDMLLSSMKDNSLTRQLRRSTRKKNRSSHVASENSTGSSSSTDGTSTLINTTSVESTDFTPAPSESRYLIMDVSNPSWGATSPPTASDVTKDLYVDYCPSNNIERSSSAGATSGIRPLATAASASKTTADLVQPWCSNSSSLPMVAALSLVTASSGSTTSQANSSVSSLAMQLEKSTVSEHGDDYGSFNYDEDVPPFRLLS